MYPYCLGLSKSSYYYLPPLPQTAVCTYVCCVVVGGVVCTVEGYNLVVSKRWKSRWPAELRARCSPTASKPALYSRGAAKHRGPTTEPCGTPSLADLTKTLFPKYLGPLKILAPLVLPSGKTIHELSERS